MLSGVHSEPGFNADCFDRLKQRIEKTEAPVVKLGELLWSKVDLDASTQGEYTNSSQLAKNTKQFNVERQRTQILPLRPALYFERWFITTNWCFYRTRGGRVHKRVRRRVLRMVSLRTEANGNYRACTRIPNEVKADYGRLCGITS